MRCLKMECHFKVVSLFLKLQKDSISIGLAVVVVVNYINFDVYIDRAVNLTISTKYLETYDSFMTPNASVTVT